MTVLKSAAPVQMIASEVRFPPLPALPVPHYLKLPKVKLAQYCPDTITNRHSRKKPKFGETKVDQTLTLSLVILLLRACQWVEKETILSEVFGLRCILKKQGTA